MTAANTPGAQARLLGEAGGLVDNGEPELGVPVDLAAQLAQILEGLRGEPGHAIDAGEVGRVRARACELALEVEVEATPRHIVLNVPSAEQPTLTVTAPYGRGCDTVDCLPALQSLMLALSERPTLGVRGGPTGGIRLVVMALETSPTERARVALDTRPTEGARS
jgi:hypothetical protein